MKSKFYDTTNVAAGVLNGLRQPQLSNTHGAGFEHFKIREEDQVALQF